MATPFEQRIIRDVDEYGWFGMSVGLREDRDDVREWWTQSVGLPKTDDWPQFMMPAHRRRQILFHDENSLFPGDPRCDSTATDFQSPKEAS